MPWAVTLNAQRAAQKSLQTQKVAWHEQARDKGGRPEGAGSASSHISAPWPCSGLGSRSTGWPRPPLSQSLTSVVTLRSCLRDDPGSPQGPPPRPPACISGRALEPAWSPRLGGTSGRRARLRRPRAHPVGLSRSRCRASGCAPAGTGRTIGEPAGRQGSRRSR